MKKLLPFPVPLGKENTDIPIKIDGYVPLPYWYDKKDIEKMGFVYDVDEFDQAELRENSGVLSYDRRMVIVFCDLIGSTNALRILGSEKFRDIQISFFGHCWDATKEANKIINSSYPRVVIDKFMGDCAMFYVDCGNSSESKNEVPKAAGITLFTVERIVENFENDNKIDNFNEPIDIGLRFGIAYGKNVILSVLGPLNVDNLQLAPCDFTVTGEVANLAARLEHATSSEFLEAISEKRQGIEIFINSIKDKDGVRNTTLGADYSKTDRQIIDLYNVCEKKYQIRVDERFRNILDSYRPENKLPWKPIPFSPKGFYQTKQAYLLGGNTSCELFRSV